MGLSTGQFYNLNINIFANVFLLKSRCENIVGQLYTVQIQYLCITPSLVYCAGKICFSLNGVCFCRLE